MKKCFQKEKYFPRRNLMRHQKLRRKFHAWKFLATKFQVAKLDVAKISCAKVSCAEISGCEIFSGEISRGENVIRRNLQYMQTDTAKIFSFPPLQMHYLKYLNSRRKFNNFRKNLAITPFFQNLMNFKKKLRTSWNLTLFNRKNWKNFHFFFLAKYS